MPIKRFWQSCLSAAAVFFLMLATPALSQSVSGDPGVTVYESPT